MRNRMIDFIGNRKKYFISSGILMLMILLSVFVFSVELDIAFRGGTIIDYTHSGEAEDVSLDEVRALTEEILEQSVTVTGNFDKLLDRNGFQIVLVSQSGVSNEKMISLEEKLKEQFADYDFKQTSVRSVNPTMGREFFKKSLLAVLVGSIFILLYIGFRFRKIGGFSAGVFAVIAMLHDVAVVFGVFVVFRIPINDSFIAVVLTILGYSINSSIVVYDRIRENEQLHPSMALPDVVNMSLNQTLTRNIATTATTLMAMIVILIVTYTSGVSAIMSFVVPIIFGLMSGFYTSTFLASEMWVSFHDRKKTLAVAK